MPGIVDPAFRARQAAPVVPVEKDDGVIGQPVFFELGEKLSHLVVHGSNQVVIVGPIAADDRVVGIVGRKLGLGRVVTVLRCQGRRQARETLRFRADATLMGDGKVDNGKEGLTLRAASPVGFAAAFIPGGEGRVEVVVGLDVVRAVVARRPPGIR